MKLHNKVITVFYDGAAEVNNDKNIRFTSFIEEHLQSSVFYCLFMYLVD
jgi:hypothetical protein